LRDIKSKLQVIKSKLQKKVIFLSLYLKLWRSMVTTLKSVHREVQIRKSVDALWGGDHRPPLYDWQTRTVWPENIKSQNCVI